MGDPPALGVLGDAGRLPRRRRDGVLPDRGRPPPPRAPRPGRGRACVPRRALRPGAQRSRGPARARVRRPRHARAGRAADRAHPRLHPVGLPRGDGALLRRPRRTTGGRRARRTQRRHRQTQRRGGVRRRPAGAAARQGGCAVLRDPRRLRALAPCRRPDQDGNRPMTTPTYAEHLTPAHLAAAQRHLLAKAIAEFAHEHLVAPASDPGLDTVAAQPARPPKPADPGLDTVAAQPARPPTDPQPARPPRGYTLTSPGAESTYSFTARVLDLEHWVIDPDSLTRTVDRAEAPLDVLAFVTEFAARLGLTGQLLPTYLEELSSTLAAAAWKLHHGGPSAHELADADHQTVEAAMTEGHPAFLANNGRIGFGGDDYAAYAPETGRPVRLVWLAARRAVTHLALGDGLTEQDLYAEELGPDVVAAFRARLIGHGLDPDDYLFVPVHPWQWVNRMVITFAPDLARRDLVHLGEGSDDHRPQQSIRTFANLTDPGRHYVKTALAIQNMGFLRGLSPAYMRPTPAINDWVHDLVAADPELQDCDFEVLRERATVGYTGDAYHALPDRSAYTRMVAALWRESPVHRLTDGERAATMASLLHRDHEGTALATTLVKASGLMPEVWLRTYLRAYVRPIVHCLLRHDLAFMPHGENLVMVLRDHVPVRMLMKDIGEEIAVMDDQPLPAEVERCRASVPQDVKALALHTDVFDGFLRYLAAILDEDGVLPAELFWAEVADCVDGHLADHPELAEAAAAYDLFRSEFRHSCLNRLQLRNTLQMVDLTDQAESLIFAGTLANPIAAHRRSHDRGGSR
ncbi:IucA/IucC family siderophore biosynthesis protein [Nocardioides sp.]|uniref:IucA/IucC family protein n=1 Tax=Nocardioides sp. TaxID=35761 RepID=UPI0027371A16|nr:IucA/IucC family protein [Nocardioides sp.]MDP3889670.1 IucA/IucC family protein [Nocardioides sp.]